MIKQLQKRFVISAMLVVTILLVGLLGTINALNAWVTVRQTDEVLDSFIEKEMFSQLPARRKVKQVQHNYERKFQQEFSNRDIFWVCY